MKTTLWTIMLLCAINNISAQVKSQVKESFELTSIAFRLAGAEEYINNTIPGYTADIDNYFSKYREHKLISYIKKIREEQGIAYDAVPAATGCIEIKRGKVIIDPQCDASKISMIDSRWTEESFRTFVRLLNDFYRQTKFKDFYTLHRGLYDIAETRLNTILVDLNAEWFKSMFGEGPENTIVVASLCNGPGNYAFNGITKGEKRGIVIGCSTDKEGNPAYSRFLITVIVHELLHHYTNPCLAQYWSQIDSASQIIYPHVKDKMAKLAYGSTNSTMIEWFNNLLTIMYFKDNPNRGFTATHLTAWRQHEGFIWMERSMTFMEHFRNHRNLYSTIKDFMPEIVSFVNYTASDFDNVLKEYDNKEPYITDIFPISNSILPLGIDTIQIRFSKPMFGAYGIRPLDDKRISPPYTDYQPFWKDKYTFCIILDRSKLEKGKTYGFKLNRAFFQSEKTYPMKEDFPYTFKMPDE